MGKDVKPSEEVVGGVERGEVAEEEAEEHPQEQEQEQKVPQKGEEKEEKEEEKQESLLLATDSEDDNGAAGGHIAQTLAR